MSPDYSHENLRNLRMLRKLSKLQIKTIMSSNKADKRNIPIRFLFQSCRCQFYSNLFITDFVYVILQFIGLMIYLLKKNRIEKCSWRNVRNWQLLSFFSFSFFFLINLTFSKTHDDKLVSEDLTDFRVQKHLLIV